MSLATEPHAPAPRIRGPSSPTRRTSAPSLCSPRTKCSSSARSATSSYTKCARDLIAGGIGVTPLKGVAEYAADRALPISIRLVCSNPNEDEIIDRRRTGGAATARPLYFRVLHTLTRTADRGWQGTAGRIHRKLLQEAARDLKDPIYYVSGTPSMVMGTFWLLRDEGIPEGDIEVEAFRGYR